MNNYYSNINFPFVVLFLVDENEDIKDILSDKKVITVKPMKSDTQGNSTKTIRFADDVKENDGETGKKANVGRIPKEQECPKIRISSITGTLPLATQTESANNK